MSRKCDLTLKAVLTGNNVSHSNRKSRRRYLPNLHSYSLVSETIGSLKLRLSNNALRSIDFHGSFDSFILSQPNEKLSDKALRVKRKIKATIKKNPVKEVVLL